MRFLATLLLLFAGLAQATTATTQGSAALYDQPNGQVLATLLPHSLLEVGERQGGWYAVKAGNRQGWVRSGSLRFAGRKESDTVLSGLWGWLNSGRSASRGSAHTTTVGIRGLDAGDLAQAVPDHQAVENLEQLRVTPQAARQYAAQLPLKSQPVSALGKEK